MEHILEIIGPFILLFLMYGLGLGISKVWQQWKIENAFTDRPCEYIPYVEYIFRGFNKRKTGAEQLMFIQKEIIRAKREIDPRKRSYMVSVCVDAIKGRKREYTQDENVKFRELYEEAETSQKNIEKKSTTHIPAELYAKRGAHKK